MKLCIGAVCLFTFLITVSSFGNNPQRHFCQLTEGQFHAIEFEQDIKGFCAQGPAVIDAMSLFQHVTGEYTSFAVKAVLANQDCFLAGGKIVFSQSSILTNSALCQFKDQSMVSALSLSHVPNGFNDQLLRALQKKF
jgi:hypothetical protein